MYYERILVYSNMFPNLEDPKLGPEVSAPPPTAAIRSHGIANPLSEVAIASLCTPDFLGGSEN